MADVPSETPRPDLSPEDRQRLAREARRAVRLLAVFLEDAGDDPSAATDAAALLEKLQAAVEPLRTAAASLSGEGTLSAGGSLMAGPATLSGSGTVSMSAPGLLTVSTKRSTSWNVEAPRASGTGAGTWGFSGSAEGPAPEAVPVTAVDVPGLIAEIADTLLDMRDQGRGLSNADIIALATFVQGWLAMLLTVLLKG
jgi:hypothetical protein